MEPSKVSGGGLASRPRKSRLGLAIGIAVVLVVLVLVVVLNPLGFGFTGIKVSAGPSVSWHGYYLVYRGSTGHDANVNGAGNAEIQVDCPSGWTMRVQVSAYDLTSPLTVETWVRGQKRESNSGSYSVSVGAVC